MLRVPISGVRPGMVIARPICHARSGVRYVQKGYALDTRTIRRLTDLEVHSVWIECSGLADVENRINEQIVAGQEKLGRLLANTVEQLRSRTDATVDCRRAEETVGALLNDILDDPAHEPFLASLTGDCGALVRHQTSCCYLCLLLGTHLSGYIRRERRKMPSHVAEDVRQLGVGAFLHDIGKVRLPDEIQQRHVLNADPDDRRYRSHTLLGYEMLRGGISALASYLTVHHHQRYDGCGFPKVRSRNPAEPPVAPDGARIHIFARILAVANVFDHLLGTADDPRPTVQALHALQQPRFDGWFDPVVVAALTLLMPPFMLGSVVTLTDSSLAVVVRNHSDGPCYPTVRRLSGEPGAPDTVVAEEDVDLLGHPQLSVREVDGVDVRPFFFEPADISTSMMAYWGLQRRPSEATAITPGSILDEDPTTAPTSR